VYLRDPALTALDVALLLGYAEQSSFTRAFRNWFGTTPSDWRLAWRNGALYVGAVNRILRYDDIDRRLESPPLPVTVTDSLPRDTHHGWKFIAFGPDGKLYVPVGAPCNICEPGDPYANILRMNADGSGARGVRTRRAQQRRLRLEPGRRRAVVHRQRPRHAGRRQPARRTEPRGVPACTSATRIATAARSPTPNSAPAQVRRDFELSGASKLGPHVARLGMRFYTGEHVPRRVPQPGLHRRARLVEPQSKKIGYRVALVRVGWQGRGLHASPAAGCRANRPGAGRPMCWCCPTARCWWPTTTPDAIYRIAYRKP
jgi:hypothetical protein